jgi:hypothetical protein
MRKYEYVIKSIKKEAELLLMGKEGWQLTAVEEGRFYFQRTLPNPYSTITNKGPK